MFLLVNLSENGEYQSINNKIIEKVRYEPTSQELLEEMERTQHAHYGIVPCRSRHKIPRVSSGQKKMENIKN